MRKRDEEANVSNVCFKNQPNRTLENQFEKSPFQAPVAPLWSCFSSKIQDRTVSPGEDLAHFVVVAVDVDEHYGFDYAGVRMQAIVTMATIT